MELLSSRLRQAGTRFELIDKPPTKAYPLSFSACVLRNVAERPLSLTCQPWPHFTASPLLAVPLSSRISRYRVRSSHHHHHHDNHDDEVTQSRLQNQPLPFNHMNSPFPKSSSVAGEGRIVAKLLPDGISGLETIVYQYPLKLITPSRPPETKSVLVFLLSYGGGLVGGDTVNLSIEVNARAKLSIVTQGHTKIFKSPTTDVVTRQALHVHIAPGAGVCLLPDPVQPFEGSVYEQVQIFKLAKDASLCLLDWVTQGRTARGEDWSFVKWVGRNEIWSCRDDKSTTTASPADRLLVRDSVILNGSQAHAQLKSLRESMQSMGVVGTLLLRGPMTKALGEFFLAEFAALPRLGARDFRNEDAKKVAAGEDLSPLQKWRTERLRMEKENKLLWSAANVRGCVVVKFGAPAVEAGRLWVGSMLCYEGSVARHFGEHALMCMKW